MQNVTTRPARVLAGVVLLLCVALCLAPRVDAQASQSNAGVQRAPRTYVAPIAPPNRPAPTTAQAAPAPTPTRAPHQERRLPDIIYIQPVIGAAYVHLKALDASNFDPVTVDPTATPQDFVKTSKGSGLRYGVAAGVNVIFLHLGARLAFTQTSGFTLGTAQAEAALQPKLGPIEPSVRFGIGYAWLGDVNYTQEIKKATSVYGLAIGAGIGLDVRLGQVVGIGIAVDADLLNMSRSTKLQDATLIKASSGSAVGIQAAFTGHLTLHI